MNTIKPLSFLDLFSGAGGWSVGFEAAGLKHAQMYDFNESACITARANFGDIVQCCDLSNSTHIDFPKVDIVVGSPPCQGFSNEGKKNPDDPRNSLVWTFLNLIEKIQPQFFVFENVPGFKGSYGGKYFEAMAKRLDESGYLWSESIVNAADYGVPQYRKRFLIVASKYFQPSIPTATHFKSVGLLGEMKHVSLWDAISDLPVPLMGDRLGEFDYELEPQNDYQKLMRLSSSKIFNHTAQKHSDRVLDKIRSVPIGGNMSSIVDIFSENNVKYEGGYRRAEKDRPSYTAYWTRGMTSIHPEQHRFLTPRECARIQSFPDDFVFQGTTIQNYTQICNAVPPLMAFAFAKSLQEQFLLNLENSKIGCQIQSTKAVYA